MGRGRSCEWGINPHSPCSVRLKLQLNATAHFATDSVTYDQHQQFATTSMPVLIEQVVTHYSAGKALARAVADVNRAPLVFPSCDDPISYFFATTVAEISADDYVQRLLQYTQCSDAVFVHATVLLQRLANKDKRLTISPHNIHRLLITAVVISAKFLDHAWFANSYYARVGGIPSVEEMNMLEVQMLKLLDYRVFVPPEEIMRLCAFDLE